MAPDGLPAKRPAGHLASTATARQTLLTCRLACCRLRSLDRVLRSSGRGRPRAVLSQRCCRLVLVSLPFPEPAIPVSSRAEVFLGYLDYFRSRLVSKLEALPAGELRRSRLASGWTPIELLKHVAHDELRWLEWRFDGRRVGDPWADDRDGRWYVAADQTLPELVAALHRPRAAGPWWSPTILLTWASPARGGGPLHWSGSCSTCCRSTPVTSATSTSSASSPTARSENEPALPRGLARCRGPQVRKRTLVVRLQVEKNIRSCR